MGNLVYPVQGKEKEKFMSKFTTQLNVAEVMVDVVSHISLVRGNSMLHPLHPSYKLGEVKMDGSLSRAEYKYFLRVLTAYEIESALEFCNATYGIAKKLYLNLFNSTKRASLAHSLPANEDKFKAGQTDKEMKFSTSNVRSSGGALYKSTSYAAGSDKLYKASSQEYKTELKWDYEPGQWVETQSLVNPVLEKAPSLTTVSQEAMRKFSDGLAADRRALQSMLQEVECRGIRDNLIAIKMLTSPIAQVEPEIEDDEELIELKGVLLEIELNAERSEVERKDKPTFQLPR